MIGGKIVELVDKIAGLAESWKIGGESWKNRILKLLCDVLIGPLLALIDPMIIDEATGVDERSVTAVSYVATSLGDKTSAGLDPNFSPTSLGVALAKSVPSSRMRPDSDKVT